MDTMDGPVAEGAAGGGASPGVAFALVVGAGLATVVGAVIALFCPNPDPRFLGLGLGLSTQKHSPPPPGSPAACPRGCC